MKMGERVVVQREIDKEGEGVLEPFVQISEEEEYVNLAVLRIMLNLILLKKVVYVMYAKENYTKEQMIMKKLYQREYKFI